MPEPFDSRQYEEYRRHGREEASETMRQDASEALLSYWREHIADRLEQGTLSQITPEMIAGFSEGFIEARREGPLAPLRNAGRATRLYRAVADALRNASEP